MAGGGKSRFTATCAHLRQYMRDHRVQGQCHLVHLFHAPPPPPPATEEKDDRTMELFPVCAAMAKPAQDIIRPEVKKNKAPMTILYKVVAQEEEAQMRTSSLHRFLKKRKLRISDANHDHNEDSIPAKKKKGAADGKPLQDVSADGKPLQEVSDASWLRL